MVKRLPLIIAALVLLLIAEPLWDYLKQVFLWANHTAVYVSALFSAIIFVGLLVKAKAFSVLSQATTSSEAVQNKIAYTEDQIVEQNYGYLVDDLFKSLCWQQGVCHCLSQHELLKQLAHVLEPKTYEKLEKSILVKATVDYTKKEFDQLMQAVQRML